MEKTGAWTETVVYTFTDGADGQLPLGTLVYGLGDLLYGTAYEGGTTLDGTVFSLAP